MATLVNLKQARGRVKAQLTRISNTITDNVKSFDAKVRLKKIEELWYAFEKAQAKVEEKEPEDRGEDEGVAELFRQECEGERALFESMYFQVAARLQAIIDAEEAQTQTQAQILAAQSAPPQGSPVAAQVVAQHPNTPQRKWPKLPELKLIEFNGDYTKWIVFKNSYETTIHNSPEIPAVMKHQYLIGVLEGEARKVIEGYSISEENYESAWTLLKNTYDNQMLIVETHLDELFNFPAITKENKADSLRQFVWHIQSHVSSLKTLLKPLKPDPVKNQPPYPVDQWDILIIHLARKRLDFAEQRDWQEKVKERTPQNMPTLTDFLKFLTERCHALMLLGQNKPKQAIPKDFNPKENKKDKRIVLATTTTTCRICNGDHPIYRCGEILKRTPDERKRLLMEKKHCTNCLAQGHMSRDCRGSGCKRCGAKHNTLLHREQAESQSVDNTITTAHHSGLEEVYAGTSVNISKENNAPVLLSTGLVKVRDHTGTGIIGRALLDPGSQSHLITNKFLRKLKLQTKSAICPISYAEGFKSTADKTVLIRLQSTHSDYAVYIECLVLEKITELLPQREFKINKIVIPKGTQLADPKFNVPGDIDLLIGSKLYWKIVIGAPRNYLKGQPALQNTRIGWILGGELPAQQSTAATSALKITNQQLHAQIEKLWKEQEIPEIPIYTKEERTCEEHFVATHERDSEGRFLLRMPTRPEVILGDSMTMARRRFHALERRLTKQPELKQAYHGFMDKYGKMGHMSLVKDTNTNSESNYFIPHQAILRLDSTTTKLRVVFDASANTTSGTSLNDKLMPGPNLQRELFEIVSRFRMYKYVVTSDIEMMFRQIQIHEKDRSLQQILWRYDSSSPVQIYQLNTVTYGTASAPYQAMRCLQELANIYEKEYPLAAISVREDFYMDDCLSGADSLEETILLQQQLMQLLNRGGFNLRKWRSNDTNVLRNLKDQQDTDNLFVIDKEGALKTLGLFWNASKDQLQYRVDLLKEPAKNKREVLSRISQIFDPLGLLGPVLIKGKIFMQHLWAEALDWDQDLSANQLEKWNVYYLSLPQLNELQIPRNVSPCNRSSNFTLCGFSDASEKAYGACLYAVSQSGRRRSLALTFALCKIPSGAFEIQVTSETRIGSSITPSLVMPNYPCGTRK